MRRFSSVSFSPRNSDGRFSPLADRAVSAFQYVMWASESFTVQGSFVSGRGTGRFQSSGLSPPTSLSRSLYSRMVRSMTSFRVWRMESLSFTPNSVLLRSDIMRFREQGAHFFPSCLAGRKHADEELFGVIGMRREHVQGGVIVGADRHLSRSKEGFKCLPSDADVEAKYARTIQLRNAVVVVICGDQSCEWKHPVRLEKEKDVSVGLGGLDVGECLGDVFGDGFLVHRANNTPDHDFPAGREMLPRYLWTIEGFDLRRYHQSKTRNFGGNHAQGQTCASDCIPNHPVALQPNRPDLGPRRGRNQSADRRGMSDRFLCDRSALDLAKTIIDLRDRRQGSGYALSCHLHRPGCQ